MSNAETKVHGSIITSASDHTLKNVILHVLSHVGAKDVDAATLLQKVSNAGIKLAYKGLLYKSLRMLVNSGKLERSYSHKKCAMVYRIRKE